MDLIVDKDSNAILTLTERNTNFLLMEKLKHGKKAKPVARTVWSLWQEPCGSCCCHTRERR